MLQHQEARANMYVRKTNTCIVHAHTHTLRIAFNIRAYTSACFSEEKAAVKAAQEEVAEGA